MKLEDSYREDGLQLDGDISLTISADLQGHDMDGKMLEQQNSTMQELGIESKKACLRPTLQRAQSSYWNDRSVPKQAKSVSSDELKKAIRRDLPNLRSFARSQKREDEKAAARELLGLGVVWNAVRRRTDRVCAGVSTVVSGVAIRGCTVLNLGLSRLWSGCSRGSTANALAHDEQMASISPGKSSRSTEAADSMAEESRRFQVAMRKYSTAL